jgi:hypothetical protein
MSEYQPNQEFRQPNPEARQAEKYPTPEEMGPTYAKNIEGFGPAELAAELARLNKIELLLTEDEVVKITEQA